MALKVNLLVNPDILNKDLPPNLEKAGFEVAVNSEAKTDEDVIAFCKDADYVIVHQGFFPLTAKVMQGLPKTKFIHTLSIGFDAIDVAAATEQGIGIVNMRGFTSNELAEHAMALMLGLIRGITVLNNRVKGGTGVPMVSFAAGQSMTVLRGKTLGLIGFGAAGQGMVPKAKGFDMKVMAMDPFVPDEVYQKLGVEKADLDKILKEADFISIHCNLTPENKGMLGLAQFKKMKPTAYVINTARGGIINEPELCQALADGLIAGAGLDVNDPEPVQADSPLKKMDNVILTGHHAGNSREANAGLAVLPVKEVQRVVRSEWPFGLVNAPVKEKYVSKWGAMKDPTDL